MTFHDAESEGWFITGVSLPPLLDDDSEEGNDEDGNPTHEFTRLVPFKLPPAPRLNKRHLHLSVPSGDTNRRHVLSVWERKNILDRLKCREHLDEGAFQKNLSEAMQRNTKAHLRKVQKKAHRAMQETQGLLEATFIHEQKRRNMIFYKYKHLLELRNMEKWMSRARSWQCIIVCHMFLTSLIQERRAQESLETLTRLFGPMVKRYIVLKRKRREIENILVNNLSHIPFPTPQLVQKMSGTFFDGWPPNLLEKLVSKATPMYLKKGTYLLHEGDIGRSMFMITIGIVSIILPKRGKSKRRSKDNSSGIFQIKAPCYVGEFALVCKEPRSATIYCETDIGFWTVLMEDYEAVRKHLTPEVASKQKQATNLRRQQNLKRFFPLKVDFLRQLPFFEQFSDASLQRITDSVEPIVLHDRDYLYNCGDIDSSMYFIGDGIAILRESNGEEKQLTAGSCIGIFECSCDINEHKPNSIVSITYCDVWRLRRETLIDIGMSEPAALLHCRRAARADRTLRIKKDPKIPTYIKLDPYLAFCLNNAAIHRFYELCTPCICLNGERLIIAGRPASTLIILLSGAVDITLRYNSSQETFRATISSPSSPVSSTSKTPEEIWGLNSDKLRAFTRVLGAYEFAASISQYVYTVKSFGLTEAYFVDKAKLEALIPDTLRYFLYNSLKSRDIVLQAFKTKNLALLSENQSISFTRLYKTAREANKKREPN
ncbi:unnamed protein product [Phytomonas sp. Hart1]|nr:unnamed protein product [Phytomonas sp. Hart1]|eukprot:CCW68463.1 unnamed protein product [Phytomonas sp. isolate Hart1]